MQQTMAHGVVHKYKEVEAVINRAFPSVTGGLAHDGLCFVVRACDLLDVARFLRDDPVCRFVCFVDLCGVDYPGRAVRFEVVTHLLSPYENTRVRLKVPVEDGGSIPSLSGIFPGAGWFEREAFDLYGIDFSGHGDLRRLLTDYGFSGHPLRKDFPLTGHVEVRYDDEAKKVVYGPVHLMQEFRTFDYASPWEGLLGDEKAVRGEEGGRD